MAKQKRGKALKVQKGWRGTCPICGRTRVKLAWSEGSEKNARMICKSCYGRVNRT